ncbi:MAG TPA: hypothetical protein VHG90_08040 [Acidimicrobiales bacterium]|nr:hypothetical protein [Acidimicrobiales bacterium]
MSTAKRRRQKVNRRARLEAEQALPPLTEADFDQLLVQVTVRADCAHASTRTTSDGPVLTRCAVGASVAGGCPPDCASFERRRVGGRGW